MFDENVAKVVILYCIRKRRQERRRRRWYMRPLNQNRDRVGAFTQLVRPMRVIDSEVHRNYFRMSKETFDFLLSKVFNDLIHPQTHKAPILPNQRLAITLRYLASGDSQVSLARAFHCSPAVVSKIIKETCSVLSRFLWSEYLKPPTTEQWGKIAQDFAQKWDFPCCIGALDGKHIPMKAPPKSGSLYYNYKKFFSILLLAVADANYLFRVVVIGDYGSTGDAAAFAKSILNEKLSSGTLGLPQPVMLPGTNDITVPHVIVADEAFPLRVNIMRPFPGTELDARRRIFNYRLSRARRVVENSFGLLTAVWRILLKTIEIDVNSADTVVKTCVGLHNFLRLQDPVGHAVVADQVQNNSSLGEQLGRVSANNASSAATVVRDRFADWFVSDSGSVSWQDTVVNRGFLNNDV